MARSLLELVEERILGYDDRLGDALDQITMALDMVIGDVVSCERYRYALHVINDAGTQSDEASMDAARARKAIRDAHKAAKDDHQPDCSCF